MSIWTMVGSTTRETEKITFLRRTRSSSHRVLNLWLIMPMGKDSNSAFIPVGVLGVFSFRLFCEVVTMFAPSEIFSEMAILTPLFFTGPGGSTCAGYTGSENHEAEDAAMFASWGIDHLKYDSCCSHHDASQEEVQKVALTMSEALINQTHPIGWCSPNLSSPSRLF